MSEWPLVAFTLLVQSSAGMVIFIALFLCYLEKAPGNPRVLRVAGINAAYGISVECVSRAAPYQHVMAEP